MFPGDEALPSAMTSRGLTAGMSLFGSLRAHFPDTPIVVLTNSPSLEVRRFFKDQELCAFYHKIDLQNEQLAKVVAGLAQDRGSILLEALSACPPGRAHAARFESTCVDVLDYLFVPPLGTLVSPSRRSDGHDIRDAVLPNTAPDYFWRTLRQELGARYVIAEFKNYSRPVAKDQVHQLRLYLARKGLGRFGLLLSRLPPSTSALQARADAYSDQNTLIVFVDDALLREMIQLRRQGKDPAAVLQRLKEGFELDY
jgi:hypothetical protein